MPATVTHTFFAQDVYKKIDKNNIKDYENLKLKYYMFAQGTDPLMFYNILSINKGKNIRNLQNITHTTKINETFETIITYIKQKKYYNDSQTLLFLYGLITHFVLDSMVHPYIFYKGGFFDSKNPETYKYNCIHNYIETFMDNKMLEKNNYNSDKFTFKNFCFNLTPFSNSLNDTIYYTYKKVYGVENMDKIYYKSLTSMKKFLRMFRVDRYGIKKFFYKKIDYFTPKNKFRFECLSYHKVEDKRDYLNLEKKVWYYPSDKNIKSNLCFYELYEEAINEAVKIINEINNYLFDDKKISIKNIFKNKSYLTGIDCTKKNELKYFEF